MVRNVKTLDSLEMKEFSALYLKYFKENCMISGVDAETSKMILQSGSKTFVRKMVRKIKEGSRVAFVDDDGTSFDGFIVGGIGEVDCGFISHMYVLDPSDKTILLSLYKNLALELKRNGAKKIIAGGERQDKVLMSQIEDIGLEKTESYGSYVEYGKKL